MRKLFLFAVLMLSMASCQTEPMGLDVVVGGEQDAIVTVSLSEGTRAASSAGFDFNNLEASGYDLRFILEITYGDTVVRKVETSKTTSMQFPVRLIAQRDYTFTVWADLVEKGTKDDLFYNTEKGLDEIEVILDEWTPNVEARDAYTYTMTKTFSATADLSMKLTRPFAKVRVVATDIDDVLDFNIEPTNAVVVYHTDMYTAFNAVEGKVIENQKRSVSHEFAYADVDTYTDIAGQRTLFADYILVPRVDNLQQCITLSYEALQGSNRIKLNNFNTPIPVETNKVTSIVGSMLTEGGNVNITINGELGEKETITFVDTAVDMQRVIDKIEEGESKNIRLGGNVTIGNTPSTSSTRAVARDYIYIAEGQTVIIDLNGYAISHSDIKNKYAFNNNGTLIIKDSKGGGSINARGIYNGYGEGAENVSAAKIIVESGSINAMGENGGAAIFNYGIAEIKGGKFKSNGGYGLNNQAGGEMTINGGEIIGGIYNLGTLSIDGENTSVYQHISGRHAIYNYAATATINNGSFDSESGNELILADGENSTVVINGGTFDKTAKSWLMGAATGKNITFTINGGTFRGYVNMPEQSVDTFRPYGDPIVVYGGTFNFDPTNFVALGYEAIEKDGSWVIDRKGHYTDANGNYHINSAKGWLWMADQTDTFFRNKTVYLDNDIDFTGVDMRVTRMWTDEYSATFDGQNHTVSNIWMASNYTSNNQALFDGMMTVRNLNVDKTHVYGMSAVGIIGANIYGTIENCHVKNSRAYGYVWQIGGIVGLHSWGEIKNCSVENTSIECYYYGAVGAIAGAMNEVSRKITNCTIKKCRIIKEGTAPEYADYDGLFGAFAGYLLPAGNYEFSGVVEDTSITMNGSTTVAKIYGEATAPSTITYNGTQL